VQEFVFDAFSYFEPVRRAYDRSDMIGFRSLNNNTCKKVVNLLKEGYLRLGKVVVIFYTKIIESAQPRMKKVNG